MCVVAVEVRLPDSAVGGELGRLNGVERVAVVRGGEGTHQHVLGNAEPLREAHTSRPANAVPSKSSQWRGCRSDVANTVWFTLIHQGVDVADRITGIAT